MADAYTREDLDKLPRTQLRQVAVNCGMTHREATNTHSDQVKEYILKNQDKKAPTRNEAPAEEAPAAEAQAEAPRRRGRPPKNGGAAQATPSAEPAEEAPKRSGSNGSDAAERIHQVGLTMDENHQALVEHISEIKDAIAEIQHSLFILSGLTSDVLKTQWDLEEVDARVNELEEAWQNQNDSGN